MINPNKFIKRQQTSLPVIYPPVNQGDDERYLWTLNRRDQTFSIFDLNGHTLVATITLTASKTFLCAFYRPVDKCVYCFGTDTVDIIDLDPASGTFATKKSSVGYPGTLAPTTREGIYDGANDLFYIGNRYYTGNLSRTGFLNIGMSSGETFYQSRRLMMVTDTANGQICFYDVSDPKPENHKPVGLVGLATPNFPCRLINSKWYSYRSSLTAYRFSDFPTLVIEATVAMTSNLFRGDNAYDPINKKIFFGGPLSTVLNVLDVTGFTNLGNAPRTSADTNEAGTSNVVYSKYTGFIYAKGANINNLASCARIHYYDPSLAVASMWQGFLTAGEDSIATNPYSNHTMGVNSLKTYDK